MVNSVVELGPAFTVPLMYVSTPVSRSCTTVRCSNFGFFHQASATGDGKYKSAQQAARTAAALSLALGGEQAHKIEQFRWRPCTCMVSAQWVAWGTMSSNLPPAAHASRMHCTPAPVSGRAARRALMR